MAEFLMEWLWYLVAFVVGALAMYVVIGMTVSADSEEAAFSDLPGAREIGDDA